MAKSFLSVQNAVNKKKKKIRWTSSFDHGLITQFWGINNWRWHFTQKHFVSDVEWSKIYAIAFRVKLF